MDITSEPETMQLITFLLIYSFPLTCVRSGLCLGVDLFGNSVASGLMDVTSEKGSTLQNHIDHS